MPRLNATIEEKQLPSDKFYVVTIGVSADGMDALTRLLSQLPVNFPAPLAIVQHMSADATGGILLEVLNRCSKIECREAKNKEAPQPGRAHLTPVDHHILLAQNQIMVTNGAREKSSQSPG